MTLPTDKVEPPEVWYSFPKKVPTKLKNLMVTWEALKPARIFN